MRAALSSLQDKLRNHRVLAAIVGALVIIGIVAAIAARTKKPAQTAAPPPLEVAVLTIEPQDVPIYSEWIGTTDGMVNAKIQAQVSGYLRSQAYTEGAFVRKGQLLFEIDPRPFQASLGQAEGDLAKSQSQLTQAISGRSQAEAQLAVTKGQLSQSEANQRQAQLNVNKYTPLEQRRAVTRQDLDNAVQSNEAAKAAVATSSAQVQSANANVAAAAASIQAAQAQVKSSQAAVQTAQLNLGFTRITSPVDGIAGIAQAQVGDLVSPSSGDLTTVSTLDPIKVYFTVSEQEYLAYVERNPTAAARAAAQSELELQLTLSNGTTYPYKGRFYVADRQVDNTTGTIRIAGIFPNPGNILRPGQYGRVRAVTRVQEGALLVPQRALNELQGNYRIFVVDKDNKVNVRTVTLGPTVEQMQIVQGGLNAGATIIADGTQRVVEGMTVRPKPFNPPPTADRTSTNGP